MEAETVVKLESRPERSRTRWRGALAPGYLALCLVAMAVVPSSRSLRARVLCAHAQGQDHPFHQCERGSGRLRASESPRDSCEGSGCVCFLEDQGARYTVFSRGNDFTGPDGGQVNHPCLVGASSGEQRWSERVGCGWFFASGPSIHSVWRVEDNLCFDTSDEETYALDAHTLERRDLPWYRRLYERAFSWFGVAVLLAYHLVRLFVDSFLAGWLGRRVDGGPAAPRGTTVLQPLAPKEDGDRPGADPDSDEDP